MSRLIDLPEMIVRDVAELPDRTSPPDAPDMMLVTASELDRIVSDRIAEVSDARMRAALLVARECIRGHFDDDCDECRNALAYCDQALTGRKRGSD